MTIFYKYFVILLAALACQVAQAAAAREVGVGARIVPANSCIPVLSNGDLDYGVIKASQLDRDAPTFLPEKVFTVTVVCEAPVNGVKISFSDHKKDDAVRDIKVLHHPLCRVDGCGRKALGLGRDQQGRKIGALFILDKGVTKDNLPAVWKRLIPRPESSSVSFSHDLFEPGYAKPIEYAPSTSECGGVCFPGTRFAMPFGIIPVIDSKDREVTGDIRLDGAITMEIKAL